jgi:hypothetical protein
MLSLTKRVMAMYMLLFAKMVEDTPSTMFAKMNFEFLCDVNFFHFSCLLAMLKIIHALIKFAQNRDVFVCSYVVAIKICQG